MYDPMDVAVVGDPSPIPRRDSIPPNESEGDPPTTPDSPRRDAGEEEIPPDREREAKDSSK
jgi:hypothetical protein